MKRTVSIAERVCDRCNSPVLRTRYTHHRRVCHLPGPWDCPHCGCHQRRLFITGNILTCANCGHTWRFRT